MKILNSAAKMMVFCASIAFGYWAGGFVVEWVNAIAGISGVLGLLVILFGALIWLDLRGH